MLSAPYGNTGQTFAQAQPWLRQVWDYANHTGRYADLRYDFTISFVSHKSAVSSGCIGSRVQSLQPCSTYDLLIEQEIPNGEHTQEDATDIIVHEFAHILTLTPEISVDGVAEPAPDLNAIALLHFASEYDFCEDPKELLADAVLMASFHDRSPKDLPRHGYWDDCGHGSIPQDALDVAHSILNGQYPDWFLGTYGEATGTTPCETCGATLWQWGRVMKTATRRRESCMRWRGTCKTHSGTDTATGAKWRSQSATAASTLTTPTRGQPETTTAPPARLEGMPLRDTGAN